MAFEDGQQPLIEGTEDRRHDPRAEGERFPAPASAGAEVPPPGSAGAPSAYGYGGYTGGGWGYPPSPNGSFPGYAADGAFLPPPRTAMHDLRPLSMGEILDRTFTLYRSRFWLFAGISALAAVVQVISAGAQMVGFHGMLRIPSPGTAPAQMSLALMHSFEAMVVSYAAALIYLLAASVTQAATAWALAEVYLGRAAEVSSAMRVAGRRWWMFVAIAFWQICSFVWLPLVIGLMAFGAAALLAARGGFGAAWVIVALLIFGVLGGFVFGVIRYLMNSLAIPASVVEGLPVRASMRRSKVLARGSKGRIFLLLLVVWAMYMVAGVLQAPLSLLWLRAPAESHVMAQAVILLIGFVAHTLAAPVMMIGLTLMYFDQRVRQEAFDLVMLLSESETEANAPGAAGTLAGEMGHADLR
jgi:hypothetical protein